MTIAETLGFTQCLGLDNREVLRVVHQAEATARNRGQFFALAAVQPGVAHADGLTPSFCAQWAKNDFWNPNCFLGRDGSRYQNSANFVTRIQRVLRASNFYPGASNDGLFGPQTESAVIAYQNSGSPATTGLVDEATWVHMRQYKIIYQGYDSFAQVRKYRVYAGTNTSFLVDVYAGRNDWYSAATTGQESYPRFDVAPPT